jgi:hypothetical protein
MLVFAYSRGGATVAGLVAVAQMAPAAVVAPVVAPVADRRSPVILLAGGYLVQAAAMAATVAAATVGVPLVPAARVALGHSRSNESVSTRAGRPGCQGLLGA